MRLYLNHKYHYHFMAIPFAFWKRENHHELNTEKRKKNQKSSSKYEKWMKITKSNTKGFFSSFYRSIDFLLTKLEFIYGSSDYSCKKKNMNYRCGIVWCSFSSLVPYFSTWRPKIDKFPEAKWLIYHKINWLELIVGNFCFIRYFFSFRSFIIVIWRKKVEKISKSIYLRFLCVCR